MKLLNVLSEPKNAREIGGSLGWNLDEVRQVLDGFVIAELIEERHQVVPGQFVVFEPDAGAAQDLRSSLEESDNRYAGKVVRDKLALQLVLKRAVPHTLVFAGDDDQVSQIVQQMFATQNPKAATVRRIALSGHAGKDTDWQSRVGFQPHDVLTRPLSAETLFESMDRIFEQFPIQDHSHQAASEDHQPADQFHPIPAVETVAVGATTAGVES